MSRPASANDIHRYGDWEVRRRERALRVRGELQKIGGRAFDVLLALIDGGDEVVRKSDLLDAAWPNLVVEENNLSVQISTLRRLLGPGAIVNVAGLGYRLAVAPAVTRAVDPSDGAAPFHGCVAPAVSVIGRDDDIAALLPRLATARLMTIVGTGGVGKSSMARALLASTEQVWRDGLHWIDLESLGVGTNVLSLVSRSLGVVVDEDGLTSGDVMRSLSQREALIVLDNCEHLLNEVTACVERMLPSAGAVQWLATSREPLRIKGEQVVRLLPLRVAVKGASFETAMACGALALFRERAQAADQTFFLDSSNIVMALDLCRALDGLPLAIEMAAARVATLGLSGVHAQLNLPMTLRSDLRYGPGRHHTLRHAYEWSYGLLSEEEQLLFRLLQPFHGGFTTALLGSFLAGTTDSVGWTADVDAVDVLAALVDKSLVQRMPPGDIGAAPRYRLLESAREFALLQLQSRGEIARVVTRHAEAVARWFDNAENDWRLWRDTQWAAHYALERDNVVVAAAWACASNDCAPDLLVRLLSAAAQLDAFGNSQAGGFTHNVPLDRVDRASPALRARARSDLGWMHYLDANGEVGTQLLEQALEDYEKLHDNVGAYLALTRLIRLCRGRAGKQSGTAALWSRLESIDPATIPLRLRIYAESTVARHFDARVSVERLTQLARLASQAGFDLQAVLCQVNLTDQLLLQKRYADAADAASSVLAQGPRYIRPHNSVKHNLILALVRLRRIDEARRAAQQALCAVPSDAHIVMDFFALAQTQAGCLDHAALLAGRSARIKADRRFAPEPAEAAVIEDTLFLLRAGLSADELAGYLDVGASMSSEDILAIVDLR